MSKQAIRNKALMYLARREHGQAELLSKLNYHGYETADIKAVLQALVADNLQSDSRFAQALFNTRLNKGYGARYIEAELNKKGISDTVIEQVGLQTIDWFFHCQASWAKRFKGRRPETKQELQKQQKFLYNRGFEFEHIQSILAKVKVLDN